MSIEEFISTDLVCERRITEAGKIRLKKFQDWKEWIEKQPGYLGYVAWVQNLCGPNDGGRVFVIAYFSTSKTPKDYMKMSYHDREQYILETYRLYMLPDNVIAKIVFAKDFPKFTEEEKGALTWCGCCFEEHKKQPL